jgi:hypothetical protein
MPIRKSESSLSEAKDVVKLLLQQVRKEVLGDTKNTFSIMALGIDYG